MENETKNKRMSLFISLNKKVIGENKFVIQLMEFVLVFWI